MATTIGNIKSTAGTINHIVEAIRSNVLGENEELSNSPTSFLNILLDQIGSINSANFFEMLTLKQETNKSTAKTRRALISYLNDSEFVGVLGNPAIYTFCIGFTLTDLLMYSIGTSLKKITINRDTIISMLDKPQFTLDYNIDVYSKFTGADVDDPTNSSNIKNYTFYAQYKVETSSVVGSVSNPFIKSYIKIVNGVQYFMMNLPMKQYSRTVKEYLSLNSATMKFEFDVNYLNNLYGFEVFYKENDNTSYRLLVGQHDGTFNKDGYNYSLKERTTGQKSLTIKFHRDPLKFSPINGSSLKIVIYTTEGERGNFYIQNWDKELPPINGIEFVQNRDIAEEDAIFSITPAITIIGPESTGGRNELSIDELRQFVIYKSNSKNITIPELELIAKAQGMLMEKERSDLLAIYFKLIGYIEYQGLQIATTPGFVNLDISKLPYSRSVENFVLTPLNLMSLETDINRFNLIDNPIENRNYIENYNSRGAITRNYFFPYFMKINLGSYVDSKVYDMSSNITYPTIFEYYNNGSNSIAGIGSCKLYRNPMNESIEYNETHYEYNGKYYITFDLQVDALMYTSIKSYLNGNTTSKDLVVYVGLKGVSTSYFVNDDNLNISTYPIGSVNDLNNTLLVTVELDTDSGVDNYDRVHLIKRSVIQYPRIEGSQPNEECFIDSTVDVKLYVSFKGTTKSSTILYNQVLTSEDHSDGFVDISAVYSIEGVNLLTNITDMIKPTIDIKLDQSNVYETYTTNIQDKYSSTIIAKNPDGSEQFETVDIVANGVVNSMQVPVILHRVGELIFNEDGSPVYAHVIGDIVYDVSGNPILKSGGGTVTICEIIDLPLVDRIHSGSGYDVVMKAFDDIRSRISALITYSPTGVSAKLGVFNTVGGGDYYFIDKTLNDIVTPLDRMALSLCIGVKIDSDIDPTAITQLIKNEIVKYIRSNSTAPTLSFVEMFDVIKTNVVGIKYLELYTVNDYPTGACQSLNLKVSDTNKGIITIKNIVDLTNSDIINNVLTFKPDIDVSIIK